MKSMKFTSDAVQKHQGMADQILGHLQTKDATISEKDPGSAYEATLPEGITPEIVSTLSKHNSKFVTAAHVAVGQLAADIMLHDKSVDTVQAEVGYFGPNGNINMTVEREKSYRNFLSTEPDAPPIVKNLVFTTSIQTATTKGTSLKSVKDAMGEEFRDHFKK